LKDRQTVSGVPAGTRAYSLANPALEAPGYFQASLRDFTKPLSRLSLNGMFIKLVLLVSSRQQEAEN